MKIVYLNYMWDLWGLSIGSTIKALELLRALKSCGHEVKEYWQNDDFNRKSGENLESPSRVRNFLKDHFQYYLHEPGQIVRNFTWIKQELAILEQEKPDLVISRLTSYGNSPQVVARKTGIPFLIEADCPASYEKIVFQKFFRATKWLLYRMEKQFLAAGKAAFTVSNQIKQYFDRYQFPSDFMQVIPNGADPERFNPAISGAPIRQKYDLEGYTVIGFVGSFIYWHGIENLINIIEATLASDPKVKFLMVGEGGPMKPMLEKFIRERKLQKRAILTGFVSHDEIPQYISAMDIVLAPYPKLDFFYYSPVKIYEYMSCGKPVVTTRIGQIAEILQDHVNGILNDPDHLEMFKSSILELIQKPELRHQIGAAARQTVLEHYTWRHRGEQLSHLCEKCIH